MTEWELALNPFNPVGYIAEGTDGIGAATQRAHTPATRQRRPHNMPADESGRAKNKNVHLRVVFYDVMLSCL
jgi:hypothetical protein